MHIILILHEKVQYFIDTKWVFLYMYIYKNS